MTRFSNGFGQRELKKKRVSRRLIQLEALKIVDRLGIEEDGKKFKVYLLKI